MDNVSLSYREADARGLIPHRTRNNAIDCTAGIDLRNSIPIAAATLHNAEACAVPERGHADPDSDDDDPGAIRADDDDNLANVANVAYSMALNDYY
jgi:hypothetical protein